MKRFFPFVVLIIAASCNKKNPAECSDSTGIYHNSQYPVGVAIDFDALQNNVTYRKIAGEQFNSATAENIFKPEFLHPSPTQYNWSQADQLVKFCNEKNQRLHGHTLIWHNQLPKWMREFSGTSLEWEHMMKDHIDSVVKHFKGKVSGWDVINEAFNEDGTLRNNIWRQNIGDSYIEKAFRYAHEADPDVLLFYNDYTLEMNTLKRTNVIQFLNNLRLRGVRVDGIGVQMHINIAYPEKTDIADALMDIADEGYKIHLSEIDISVNPFKTDIELSSSLFTKQAEVLSVLILNYNGIPHQFQYGITFWGVADSHSWLLEYYGKEDYPLLFDDNYHPKQAYCKLKTSL